MRNIVNMSVYNAGMRNVSSMLPETETILHQFFLPFIKRLAHLLDDPRFLWNDLQPGSSATGYPSCQTIQDSRGTICSLPLQQQAASHARRSKIPVERFAVLFSNLPDDPRFPWNDLQSSPSATGCKSCQTIQDSRGTICTRTSALREKTSIAYSTKKCCFFAC